MVDEKCDYMRRNRLGDPEREDATILARKALAQPSESGGGERTDTCSHCNGEGIEPECERSPEMPEGCKCSHCGGTGQECDDTGIDTTRATTGERPGPGPGQEALEAACAYYWKHTGRGNEWANLSEGQRAHYMDAMWGAIQEALATDPDPED